MTSFIYPLSKRSSRFLQENPSDNFETIERVCAGDTTAFEDLVHQYKRSIYHLVTRYVGVQDAEDIMQQTFVKAFLNIRSFRRTSSFRAWLYRIAINLSLNHQRKRKRAREVPFEEYDTKVNSPSDQQRILQKERIRKAVIALPEKQRLIVELRLWEGMSFQEIGLIVKCSEASARSNFRYALKNLKAKLDDEEAHE